MLSKRLKITLNWKKSSGILPSYSCDNIPLAKVPENIAQENNLCNVILILLVKYCRGKVPVHGCRRGCRPHGTGKHPVQCCLNTPGQH